MSQHTKDVTASRTVAAPAPITPPKPESRGARSWVVLGVTVAIVVGSAIGMFLPIRREAVGALSILMLLRLLFLRLPVAFAMIIPSLLGMHVLRGEGLVFGQLAAAPSPRPPAGRSASSRCSS